MFICMFVCMRVQTRIRVCACVSVCCHIGSLLKTKKGVLICMHIELWPSIHSDESNCIAQVTKGKKKKERLQIKLSDS